MVAYFAYASNMDSDQMVERLQMLSGQSQETLLKRWQPRRAVLHGYRLAFTTTSQQYGAGVSDIVPAAGERVEGVVYHLRHGELAQLGRFEAEGSKYSRVNVQVEVDGQKLEAVAFEVLSKGGPFRPSRSYLQKILKGAREHGLSEGYLRRLRAIQTQEET